MEKLTKERAYDFCVEHWNDIAENRYREKCDSYLLEKYNPEHDCFACEYYSNKFGDLSTAGCLKCPFSIYDNDEMQSIYCEGDKSIYKKWLNLKIRNGKIAKKYAIAIADLFIE